MTSDEVRAAVARELLGLLENRDFPVTMIGEAEQTLNLALATLGGTWDLEHTHVWPDRRPGDAYGDLHHCADPCYYRSGRHVVRHRWVSNEVTP